MALYSTRVGHCNAFESDYLARMPLAILQGPPPPDALVALLNEYVDVVPYVGRTMRVYRPAKQMPLLSPTDSWIDQIVYAAVMCRARWSRREVVALEQRTFYWRGGYVSVYVPDGCEEGVIVRVLQAAERARPDVFAEQIEPLL